MPALTTTQEYDAVRLAIQTLSGTGAPIASFTLGDMTVSYSAQQLPWLQEREVELARRLSQRNIRKRTAPDFQ